MKNLLTQVTLDKATRRKDKSVSMSFITSLEQSSEDFMEIDKALDQTGVLYFKPDGNLTQKELDALDKVDLAVEGKTKSQRLRNVIWVEWNQKYKDSISFNDWYAEVMEGYIQDKKDNLDED